MSLWPSPEFTRTQLSIFPPTWLPPSTYLLLSLSPGWELPEGMDSGQVGLVKAQVSGSVALGSCRGQHL